MHDKLILKGESYVSMNHKESYEESEHMHAMVTGAGQQVISKESNYRKQHVVNYIEVKVSRTKRLKCCVSAK